MMPSFHVQVIVVLAACLAVAYPAGDFAEYKLKTQQIARRDVQLLTEAFWNGTVQDSPIQVAKDTRAAAAVKFVYTNCADPKKESLVSTNVLVKPDPIRLPGTIVVSGNSTIKKSFGSPLKASLTIHKKVLGFWIEIPCVDNIGSCDYSDICTMLKKVKTCPPVLVKAGINCTCPFPAVNVDVKNLPVKVNVKVPSIADGSIKVKAELTSGSNYVTCVEFEVNLE